LTPEEFEVMKTHAAHGEATIQAILKEYPGTHFLEMARDIAGGTSRKIRRQRLSAWFGP
jgi:hypothetical protein